MLPFASRTAFCDAALALTGAIAGRPSVSAFRVSSLQAFADARFRHRGARANSTQHERWLRRNIAIRLTLCDARALHNAPHTALSIERFLRCSGHLGPRPYRPMCSGCTHRSRGGRSE